MIYSLIIYTPPSPPILRLHGLPSPILKSLNTTASTIQLRLQEALNLPETPSPRLATYEAHYYEAATNGLHAHATPLF